MYFNKDETYLIFSFTNTKITHLLHKVFIAFNKTLFFPIEILN